MTKTAALILGLLATSCAPAYADLSLKWNPDTQGFYINGGIGGLTIDSAPRDPLVRAPYELTEAPSDPQLALQVVAVALAMQQTAVWENHLTGNYGRVEVYGEIDGVPKGCVGYNQTAFMNGDVQEEFFTACPGGGNSNTWIVNDRWIVNSVDRERFDNGCRVRFSDVRLDRGRVDSTMLVCYIPGVDFWKVEGGL